MKAVLFGGARIPSVPANLGLALYRVAIGLGLALAHGYGKLPVSDRFVDGVGEMGFPAPVVFAWAAALSEFVGGLLLALGLATRAAAFFVLTTMGVAFFVRHAADDFGTKEKAFLYGTGALLFLLVGAGRFSADALIRRR